MKPIVLASTSPRRKELLDVLGIPYYAIKPKYSEIFSDSYPEGCISEYFARKKLDSVLESIQNKYEDADFIICADTVIIQNKTIFGKPKDKQEAYSYLVTLSGKKHEVNTSIAIYNRKTSTMILRTTKNIVSVKSLSNNDIEWNLSKNEWQDAAGAYKIQGTFQRFVTKIEGTQSSVMGLPLSAICDILIEQGYEFL